MKRPDLEFRFIREKSGERPALMNIYNESVRGLGGFGIARDPGSTQGPAKGTQKAPRSHLDGPRATQEPVVIHLPRIWGVVFSPFNHTFNSPVPR